MRSKRFDYESAGNNSPYCMMLAVEGKSIPSLPRRKLRRRFGYLLAVTLIAAGALLNLRLVFPALLIAFVLSLSVAGIAVLVQMPVQFLAPRSSQPRDGTSDNAIITK